MHTTCSQYSIYTVHSMPRAHVLWSASKDLFKTKSTHVWSSETRGNSGKSSILAFRRLAQKKIHTVKSYNRYSEDQWIKSIFGTKRTVQKLRGTVKHKERACVLPCPPKNPVDDFMGENTSSCCVRHSWKWRQLSSQFIKSAWTRALTDIRTVADSYEACGSF